MREAARVLLFALALAIFLPIVTVIVLSVGRVGFALVGALFVFVCFLVIYSDLSKSTTTE